MTEPKSNSFQALQDQSGLTIDRSQLSADSLRRAVQPSHAGMSAPQIETPFIVAKPDPTVKVPMLAANRDGGGLMSVVEGLPARNGPPEPQDKILTLRRRMPAPSQKFRAIQRWEGTVLSMTKDGFHALLRDLDSA